ncbi:MAG: hypothetical protein WC635_02570 [Bacteriovorax sp.]|jgi:hypothetical protein
MRDEQSTEIGMSFFPKNENARIAVERAREIVKENNKIITKLKVESNIQPEDEDTTFSEAEKFFHEDSYAFDLYKIKSSNGIGDFFKDIFGGY